MLNLDACQLKAPFTGYMTTRHKQPYETVQRLEKVFTIVDGAKVYAVANVPARLLSRFPINAQVAFVDNSGKTFNGTVDRVGRIFDAKSNTKKVYALIDNSGGKLEIGMTGSLKPEGP